MQVKESEENIMNGLMIMDIIQSSNVPDYVLLEDENSKYIEWIFALILKNKCRAKEMYYLLSGFCGSDSERRCVI